MSAILSSEMAEKAKEKKEEIGLTTTAMLPGGTVISPTPETQVTLPQSIKPPEKQIAPEYTVTTPQPESTVENHSLGLGSKGGN